MVTQRGTTPKAISRGTTTALTPPPNSSGGVTTAGGSGPAQAKPSAQDGAGIPVAMGVSSRTWIPPPPGFLHKLPGPNSSSVSSSLPPSAYQGHLASTASSSTNNNHSPNLGLEQRRTGATRGRGSSSPLRSLASGRRAGQWERTAAGAGAGYVRLTAGSHSPDTWVAPGVTQSTT
ncbi:unnamed protein product, partial [Discosporangium mesarthrocarpum]